MTDAELQVERWLLIRSRPPWWNLLNQLTPTLPIL